MSSVVEDSNVVFTFQSLTVYGDGSVHRAPDDPPPLPPSSSSPDEVATKDLTLNHGHGTWARLLLPPVCHKNNHLQKLPVLLYFHGGGFVIGSTALPYNQGFLCKLAVEASVLIVSVDYRLAPESPLPAAYEDCFEALLWLNEQAKLGASSTDPWLASHADFSRCFLGGDSAGANIVHHVAMKAAGLGFGSASGQDDGGQENLGLGKRMEHICLQGLILIHPFFSCGISTADEVEANVWKFSGVSKLDHPFANPLTSGAPSLARAALPRTLVAVADKDGLRDRGIVYYKALVEAGKEAKLFVSEEEGHVFHLLSPHSKNCRPFLDELCHFINFSL